MPRRREKFISVERTRHGKTVFYFRRSRETPRIRLPDDYGSSIFWAAYKAALEAPDGTIFPHVAKKVDSSRKPAIISSLLNSMMSAKFRAKNAGREFDLTEEWITETVTAQKFKCALSSIPFLAPHTAKSSRNPYAPSLDKIDPRGGYTKANVRIVLFAINVMLQDWGEAIFYRVANGYRYTRGTKSRALFPARKSKRPHRSKNDAKSDA